MAKVIDLSLILACYNEGSGLTKSVLEIIKVLKKLERNWEIVFVEDKSVDNTQKTVEELTRELNKNANGQAKAIFHKRNEGRGKSVADGIKAAKGKICGYLDVDLEVSASYIPIFVSEIESGKDLVVGKRFYEGGLKSLNRFFASKIYSYIVKKLLMVPVDDTEAGYKFFKRSKILPILRSTQDRKWFWDTEICARAHFAGAKIGQVPVLFTRRHDKKSTVKLFSDSWDYLFKILKFRSQMSKYI